MPVKEYVDWSVRRTYQDAIVALVEARAPWFKQYAGKTRYVATVAQKLLSEVLVDKLLKMPDELVDQILRRMPPDVQAQVVPARQRTLLDVAEAPPPPPPDEELDGDSSVPPSEEDEAS